MDQRRRSWLRSPFKIYTTTFSLFLHPHRLRQNKHTIAFKCSCNMLEIMNGAGSQQMMRPANDNLVRDAFSTDTMNTHITPSRILSIIEPWCPCSRVGCIYRSFKNWPHTWHRLSSMHRRMSTRIFFRVSWVVRGQCCSHTSTMRMPPNCAKRLQSRVFKHWCFIARMKHIKAVVRTPHTWWSILLTFSHGSVPQKRTQQKKTKIQIRNSWLSCDERKGRRLNGHRTCPHCVLAGNCLAYTHFYCKQSRIVCNHVESEIDNQVLFCYHWNNTSTPCDQSLTFHQSTSAVPQKHMDQFRYFKHTICRLHSGFRGCDVIHGWAIWGITRTSGHQLPAVFR